jgi:hypothetical protein
MGMKKIQNNAAIPCHINETYPKTRRLFLFFFMLLADTIKLMMHNKKGMSPTAKKRRTSLGLGSKEKALARKRGNSFKKRVSWVAKKRH